MKITGGMNYEWIKEKNKRPDSATLRKSWEIDEYIVSNQIPYNVLLFSITNSALLVNKLSEFYYLNL